MRGVSALTRVAIRRIELEFGNSGKTAHALAGYAHFLRQPGRWLRAPEVTPCCAAHDPDTARLELAMVLERLPSAARADLLRVIQPLDEDYRRRTVPRYPPLPPRRDLERHWWCDRHLER